MIPLCDLTLPTPAENLALDEVLLEAAEQGRGAHEALRLWESPQPLVVLGRSSRLDLEVDRAACEARGIPIVRRGSGGAAVVAGPGCLMYALILDLTQRPELRMLDACHRWVMERFVSELSTQLDDVAWQGTCDLTWRNRKFSGNSLRVRRDHLLYHGTLLYHFPLDLIGACLRTPPRQPDYRAQRNHDTFVTNLPIDGSALRATLRAAWQAEPVAWPDFSAEVRQLAAEKFNLPEWTDKL